MTDAAMPVTERAVEQFVDAYLLALGAEIQKDGRRWVVTLPNDAETGFDLNGATMVVANDPSEVEDDVLAIAPGSEFIERLLSEAAERCPVGSLALTGDHLDIDLPAWITAGPATVAHQSFTPYYDRRAVCMLFHLGIETVSEYQTEELLAVTVDVDAREERPRLAETYLELADTRTEWEFPEGPHLDQSMLEEAIRVAQNTIERDIDSDVREIREQATRAAEVEVDEYRKYVRQRRDELDDQIDQLTDRIEEANEIIDAASDQRERVEALRKRKELRAERDELRSERDKLTRAIETDFPEKRREVRDRHALTVRTWPVVLTAVSYERGNLDLELRVDEEITSASFAYAVGIGVTDDPLCERCNSRLTEENALTVDGGLLVGTNCCGR